MRRIALALLATLLAVVPAGADPERRVSGLYEIHLGGVLAVEIAVDGMVDGNTYRIGATVNTANWYSMIYDAALAADSEGTLRAGALEPRRFVSRTRDPDKEQRVEVTYRDGTPVVVAEPEFDPKPWEIDPSRQGGTLDPLTAVLAGLAPVPRDALCGRRLDIYDGRRRYAVEVDAAGPADAGGEIVCEAVYRRIAGWKPRKLREQAEWPLRMYFAEGEDGLWHLVRAAGATSFGMATLRRRE